MASTLVTVTGTWNDPGGSDPKTGKVTATLNEAIQNGTIVIEADPVVGYLNDAGQLVADDGESPFKLYANDDTATSPPGSFYSFLVEIDNAPVREFAAVVSHVTSPIDITALAPIEP